MHKIESQSFKDPTSVSILAENQPPTNLTTVRLNIINKYVNVDISSFNLFWSHIFTLNSEGITVASRQSAAKIRLDILDEDQNNSLI